MILPIQKKVLGNHKLFRYEYVYVDIIWDKIPSEIDFSICYSPLYTCFFLALITKTFDDKYEGCRIQLYNAWTLFIQNLLFSLRFETPSASLWCQFSVCLCHEVQLVYITLWHVNWAKGPAPTSFCRISCCCTHLFLTNQWIEEIFLFWWGKDPFWRFFLTQK